MHLINECSTPHLNMHESYGLWLWYFNAVFVIFWSLTASTSTGFQFWVNYSFQPSFHPESLFFVLLLVSADQVRAAFLCVTWQEVENRILLFKSNLHSGKLENASEANKHAFFSGSDYACTQGMSVWIMKAVGRAAASLGNRKRSLFQAKESQRLREEHRTKSIWQEFISSEDNRTPLSSWAAEGDPRLLHVW